MREHNLDLPVVHVDRPSVGIGVVLNTALALGLIVGIVAFGYGSSVGLRGKAMHPDFYGRDVPDRVKTSPHLRARANRLVAICGIAAAILLLVPLVWLFSDLNRDRSTWELAGLAAYVFVVVVIGGYPFEKVKTL